MGNFISQLDGLEPETNYYVRAYATNDMGTAYGNTLAFRTLEQPETGTFTDDRDGTVYKTIKIGNQVWMAENLRYLPSVVGQATSSNSEPCYYVYDYNGTDVEEAKATTIYTIFGALYNWPAAMDGENSSSTNPSGVKGVCPTGWHLPSDAEWTQLVEYLGGENVAGGKMKREFRPLLDKPKHRCYEFIGIYGFLPGGYLYYADNHFHHLGYYERWSATAGTGVYDRYVYNESGKIYRTESGKAGGWSIRCVKD